MENKKTAVNFSEDSVYKNDDGFICYITCLEEIMGKRVRLFNQGFESDITDKGIYVANENGIFNVYESDSGQTLRYSQV